MELTHTFTVPAGVEETWAAFDDIESVAGCFPGAVVTEVAGDTFQGSCKVKLGPIALVYNGSGTFLEKDPVAHTMRIEAKGKDKRGNGTAGAHVTAAMTASGDSGTEVVVVTDLAITGKPAQFGRGVMQDVSDKLLGQFVACLEQKLGAAQEEPPSPTPVLVEESTASVAPGSEAPPPRQAAPRPVTPTPPAQDDALDLGATVLPVLARNYWRQALGAVLAVLLLRRLLRCRRRT